MMICQQKVLTTLAFGVNMTHAHLRFEEYDEWQWTEGPEAGVGWHTARLRFAYKSHPEECPQDTNVNLFSSDLINTGKVMPMSASSLGVQSSIEQRMVRFSSLAVLLMGISGILLPMESKMFGSVRQDPTNSIAF